MTVTVHEQALANGRLISAYGSDAEVLVTLAGATGHGLSDVKYVWNPSTCQIVWETVTIAGSSVSICYWTPVT